MMPTPANAQVTFKKLKVLMILSYILPFHFHFERLLDVLCMQLSLLDFILHLMQPNSQANLANCIGLLSNGYFVTLHELPPWIFLILAPSHFSLKCYCDVHHVGDHNDKKTCTSYPFTPVNGVKARCSKWQTCSAYSTTKAEFVALAQFVRKPSSFDTFYPVLDFLELILLLFSLTTNKLYNW